MSTSKSHMYTANMWCCNMSNIVDVYFKITHVYSKCVMLYYVEYNRCLLQSRTYLQQICDVVLSKSTSKSHAYSKSVMLYYVEYNRCLLQSHTSIQ